MALQAFVFRLASRDTGEALGAAVVCPGLRRATVWDAARDRAVARRASAQIWRRVRQELLSSLPTRSLGPGLAVTQMLVPPPRQAAIAVQYMAVVRVDTARRTVGKDPLAPVLDRLGVRRRPGADG
jgi:hypothetical protein